MVSPEVFLAVLAIVLALFFGFTNGFNDSANQVATVIKTNAMRPGVALGIAGFFDFIGAAFLGTAVAQTLGKGIIDPAALSGGTPALLVVISALCGAIIWNLWTWRRGIPSSSSHALIGGLLGSFVAGWGYGPVNWVRVAYIIIALIASPFIGFLIASLFTRLILFVGNRFSSELNRFFDRCQYVSLIFQSLSHGNNDGQKTMGVIVFILIVSGFSVPSDRMEIPLPVIIGSSLVMVLGTLSGGWRIIKTIGKGIYDIKPMHSFVSQFSSAGIIFSASLVGIPVSTTQIISSSVMGTGAAEHPKRVHWEVAKEMAQTWIITIPASGTIAAGFLFLFRGMWIYAIGMVLLAGIGYLFTHKFNIFSRIFPRTVDFRQLLLDEADKVLHGLYAVKKYCENPTPENAVEVELSEEEADRARSFLMNSLMETFATGDFEAHNIERLSQNLDDIIDCAKDAVEQMIDRKVLPDDRIREMTGLLISGAADIRNAIGNLKKNDKKAQEECDRLIKAARKKENAIRRCYRRNGNSILEENIKVTPKMIIELMEKRDNKREVYQIFVDAASKMDYSSRVVETILLKIS